MAACVILIGESRLSEKERSGFELGPVIHTSLLVKKRSELRMAACVILIGKSRLSEKERSGFELRPDVVIPTFTNYHLRFIIESNNSKGR